jgi:hypothetical protein
MSRPDPIRGIKPRAYRDVIIAAVDQGWTATLTGGNHIRLDPPGEGGPVFAAFSSGGGRGERNLRALLRKRGVIC